MADDDAQTLLREIVAITQAQQDLILTLVQVLARPDDPKSANLQNLPGLLAHGLGSKYQTARALSDDTPEDEIHSNRLDALEALLLKLDPDNVGGWQ